MATEPPPAESVDRTVTALRNGGWVASAEHDGCVFRRSVPTRIRREMRIASAELATITLADIRRGMVAKFRRSPRHSELSPPVCGVREPEPNDQLLILANATDTPPQSEAARRVWDQLIAFIDELREQGMAVELRLLDPDLERDESGAAL